MRCRFRAEKMPMVIDHDKTKTVGALILPGIYQRLKDSIETEASLSFSLGYNLAAVVHGKTFNQRFCLQNFLKIRQVPFVPRFP